MVGKKDAPRAACLLAVSAVALLLTAVVPVEYSIGGAFQAVTAPDGENWVWAPTTTPKGMNVLQAAFRRTGGHAAVDHGRLFDGAEMRRRGGGMLGGPVLAASAEDGISAASSMASAVMPLGVERDGRTQAVTFIGDRPAVWSEWRARLRHLLTLSPEEQGAWAEEITVEGGQSMSIRVERARAGDRTLLDSANEFEAVVGVDPLLRARAHGLRLNVQLETASYGSEPLAPEGVDGPSAGLAYALSHLNSSLGGDLLGDLVIVATGSIDSRGWVGPVGGLQVKQRVAEHLQADLFIVGRGSPLDRPDELGVPLLQVIRLEEAVHGICQLRVQLRPSTLQVCEQAAEWAIG